MGHAILKAIKHAADHELLEVWWIELFGMIPQTQTGSKMEDQEECDPVWTVILFVDSWACT